MKRDGTTIISSFDYAYDGVGNRSRVIEADGIRVTWSYDFNYQLTRERRSGANAYDITYTYDPAGNRRVKLEDAIRTTYAYDAANHLLTTKDNTGTTTYTFDANGNQRIVKTPAGALTTNTWDYENKLTKVIMPSGIRNTFSYDPDGRRVKKDDSTGTSKLLWDLENILLETNASDITQVIYTLQPKLYGNLISQYRSAITNFLHFDALGSTDSLTDGSAAVTDRYIQEAFGKIKSSSGLTINPFRYGGRLGYYYSEDLTSYLLRARWYKPVVGRFMSWDPALLVLGGHDPTVFEPDQWNPYVYAMGNPVLIADPSGCQGRWPWWCWLHLAFGLSLLAVCAGVTFSAITSAAATGGFSLGAALAILCACCAMAAQVGNYYLTCTNVAGWEGILQVVTLALSACSAISCTTLAVQAIPNPPTTGGVSGGQGPAAQIIKFPTPQVGIDTQAAFSIP